MITKHFFSVFKPNKNAFLLIGILFIAAFFRTLGFNWDQNQHLHPDERFLTMVLTDIKIPTSFKQYLNPQTSTLNPYHQGHSFFVYGSFPLNLVKILGTILNITSYSRIHFLGRIITIILDIGIVYLVFLIGQKIFTFQIGLLAAFFYSISVLPIQLAHFYTVDPFLNFFLVLTFYFLISLKNHSQILLKIFLLSLSFGITIACKISAIYFSPIIFIFFIFYFFKKPLKFIFYGLIFSILTLLFFRLNQPQVFSSGNLLNWNFNPQFISNIKELQSYNQMSFYPPGIQWLKTTPLLFPLKNIVLWGVGLPLGIIFIFSIIYSLIFVFKKPIKKHFFIFTILFWILFLFFYQGSQHVATMRYFLPIYPFLCLISAFFIYQTKLFHYPVIKFLLIIVLLIYPLSFISIYFKDHPRVSASNWIYQNIPIASTLATEYWDDSLPLFISSINYPERFNYQSLAVADVDSPEKITKLKDQLDHSDYLILSSNRFYLPIPNNSDSYPLTAQYYQSLFDGSLGFQKVAEFNSYPCFPPIGPSLFCFQDTLAEEAFTVYDHPKVIIFKKTIKLVFFADF